MVHAHLEVVSEVKASGDTVFVTDLKQSAADAIAGGTAADDLFKAALVSVVGMERSIADAMLAELIADSSGSPGGSAPLGTDAPDIAAKINTALKGYVPITNSNREMGHLVMQKIRTHAPVQFAMITDHNPLRWLRFAQYEASQVGGHIGDIGGGKDTKFDIDKDYVASICGIEDRRHDKWDSVEDELKQVSIYHATCTLVHDMRRRYTSDLHYLAPHLVNRHGILNIETISGAYFMTRKEWNKMDTPEKKKEVGIHSPVYVYNTEIKVPLLKYNSQYYPDLRTTGKIDGIIKVGPNGDELFVYTNDLYGRIHSDDLIVLQNTPMDGNPDKGDSSYHVRGGDNDTLGNVAKGVSAAQGLYYFGKRADGSHAQIRYDNMRDRQALPGESKSYNGTPKSIYQLGARFGIEHARDSVLGCVLPMAIQAHTDTNTYGAYCAPMSLSGTFLGPHTVDTRNPKAGMPTESELAEALSKKGRHNEVGIALQKLMPNKQGDLILFDGV